MNDATVQFFKEAEGYVSLKGAQVCYQTFSKAEKKPS